MAGGLGYKVWSSGDTLNAADLNGYCSEQSVMVFTDATDRTNNGPGTPIEGMMSYLEGDNTLSYYDGSSWVVVDVKNDTTPQLGGSLDVNGYDITSPDGTDLIDIVNGTITIQTASTSRLDITDAGVRLGAANARVTTVLDEDTMSSNSATALATQQSIKAYVDNGFEPIDADILRADTTDKLAAGYDSDDYAKGTVSAGTYTPAVADGENFIVYTNGGAHTLAAPATSACYVIHVTNNGSAGAITTSGYTVVDGDSLTTTDTHEFILYVTKINDVSHLNVVALQ